MGRTRKRFSRKRKAGDGGVAGFFAGLNPFAAKAPAGAHSPMVPDAKLHSQRTGAPPAAVKLPSTPVPASAAAPVAVGGRKSYRGGLLGCNPKPGVTNALGMTACGISRGGRRHRGLRGGTTSKHIPLSPASVTAEALGSGDFGPPHGRAVAGGWLGNQGGPISGGRKSRRGGRKSRRGGRKSRRGGRNRRR